MNPVSTDNGVMGVVNDRLYIYRNGMPQDITDEVMRALYVLVRDVPAFEFSVIDRGVTHKVTVNSKIT